MTVTVVCTGLPDPNRVYHVAPGATAADIVALLVNDHAGPFTGPRAQPLRLYPFGGQVPLDGRHPVSHLHPYDAF